MIFSMNYHEKSEYKDQVGELRILFTNSSIAQTLTQFIEGHKSQRIFVLVQDWQNFKERNIFKAINKLIKIKEYDVTFCFTGDIKNSEMRDLATYAKEYEMSFCFEKPITGFDVLYGILSLGVSDVYIASELGFSMKVVHEIVENANAKLRCYPDICQSDWLGLNSLFCFWIRPEDLEIYSQYIDVIEFWKDKDDAVIADTIYKIYSTDKKWDGQLYQVVTGLDQKINNSCILNVFGLHRMNCGKKCLKESACRLCHYVLDIAETLDEHDLKLTESPVN